MTDCANTECNQTNLHLRGVYGPVEGTGDPTGRKRQGCEG